MNWDILLKYINNEADSNEITIVKDWLHQNPQNHALLDYLVRRSESLNTPLKQTDIDEQWLRLLNRIFEQSTSCEKVRSLNWYRPLSIAASLLIITALSWIHFRKIQKKTPQLVTLQTPQNLQGTIMLPDSTQVFLAPNSTLQYDDSYGSPARRVKIEGEAFFAVKHDKARPFIVSTQNSITVTVLGTSFNVFSRKGKNPEVKVATGLVGVVANHQTHLLKAGQQLVYNLNKKQTVGTAIDIKDAASLQNHILYFKSSNSTQIATKLERWYNISIVALPSAQRHPLFSGEMKDNGINNLLNGLSYATGIKYKYKNAHTILLF